MKKLLTFFVTLMISFVSLSCSAINDVPNSPPFQFNELYLNKQIQLFTDPRLGPLNTKDSIGLQLHYLTENEITFPDNYNLRLFIVKDRNWIEIHEKPTIRSGNNILLSPSIPISFVRIVSFFPQLDDLSKEYQMRVYIFGDMSTQEGIKQVAAFVDFKLRP